MQEEPCSWSSGVVLVCKNQRAAGGDRPSCGEVHGTELKSWLKRKARASKTSLSQARVLSTSCLDACTEGRIAVAVEPGRKLFLLEPEFDRDALLQKLEAHFDLMSHDASKKGLARRALSRFSRDS